MIIQAVLGNPDHPEFGVATIPFPIPKEEYAHSISLLEQLEVGDPLKRDCKLVEIDGWPTVLNRLCGKTINVDEMDYLAKRLDSFDVYEAAQYQGTVFEHDLQDMTDLINQTFCCQQATVITNFNDLEKVGKDHYLTLKGGSCPVDELRSVDGVETALLLLERDDATVTPYGVVYDNGMKMEQLYDGVHFPEYLYEDSEMAVEVIAPDRSQKTTWLYLPMPQEQISRMLIRGSAETHHITMNSMKLSDKVMEAIEDSGSDVYSLNLMCAAVSKLNKAERSKLDAVVDMAHPDSPEQITQLVRNMDLFDFCPDVYDHASYGRYMIQESGRFDYDANLDEFYDYRAYGQQKMSSESGCFVANGYVSYHGTLSLDELMAEDPAEQYRREQGMEMGGMA